MCNVVKEKRAAGSMTNYDYVAENLIVKIALLSGSLSRMKRRYRTRTVIRRLRTSVCIPTCRCATT